MNSGRWQVALSTLRSEVTTLMKSAAHDAKQVKRDADSKATLDHDEKCTKIAQGGSVLELAEDTQQQVGLCPNATNQTGWETLPDVGHFQERRVSVQTGYAMERRSAKRPETLSNHAINQPSWRVTQEDEGSRA